MSKRVLFYALPAIVLFFAVALMVQAASYPMLDPVVNKVIQKFQTSTCEQLAMSKQQPPDEMAVKAVQMMKQDPELRTEFLNKVAGPIANKMFECGMIP
ncbi:MAG: hypothetical protein ACREO9_04845 [Lysobacterales bacterium]